MKKRICHLTFATAAMALALTLGDCEPAVARDATRTSAALSVSNRLAAVAAAGDPITLAELDQQYVTPPPDQNAAPLYELAFAAFKNDDTKSATFVADNITALPLLVKAAQCQACRYPVVLTDGYSAKLPHLIKIKRAVTLLQKVAVNQTAKKRSDAATTTLLAGLSLARSLDNEPLILSKMVEFASIKLVLDGMSLSFSLQPFSAAQLQSLQAALKTSETGTSLRRLLIGERASMIFIFQMPDADMAKFGSDLAKLSGTGEAEDLVAYRKTEMFLPDFAFALDCLSNFVALADVPFPQSLDDLPQAVAQSETAAAQGFILSKIVLPNFGASLGKSADATAYIRCAQVALAVEHYRLQHANSLPGALTALVPDFLTAIPADPFDGQPLRFKPLPDKGYIVYSIGKDRKDDDGIEKAPDGKTQLDLAFTVKR